MMMMMMMMMMRFIPALAFLVLANLSSFHVVCSFVVRPAVLSSKRVNFILKSSEKPQKERTSEETRKNLESKMSSWEASEEEIKKASFGGLSPGKLDEFDVGLWLLFPLMVGAGAFFIFFPLIMDNIDVTSVGPPPTS